MYSFFVLLSNIFFNGWSQHPHQQAVSTIPFFKYPSFFLSFFLLLRVLLLCVRLQAALHLAAFYGRTSFVTFLLQSGASASLVSAEAKTALEAVSIVPVGEFLQHSEHFMLFQIKHCFQKTKCRKRIFFNLKFLEKVA